MRGLTLALACCLSSSAAAAQGAVSVSIKVRAEEAGRPMPPTLHGLFLEEINRGGDGGLYAEMLANRSFEDDPSKPVEWTMRAGDGALDRREPLHANNPTALRLAAAGVLVNAGFKGAGLAVRQGVAYRASAWLRAARTTKVVFRLETPTGIKLAEATASDATERWSRLEVVLTSNADERSARLIVAVDGPAQLDMVSLMPRAGWRGLPFRFDLAELLAALRPGHIRFPGGCFVEGETMALAHRWKDTIGPVEQRPPQPERWGYHSTGGFGVHEFLLWCEVLEAEPVYVVNAGMSHQENVPMARMQPYVQDALDFVEYARGPATSPWGAKRAAAGHPAPFRCNFLEIGNENGGAAYAERYALFHDALKAKYPDLKLIANEWDYRVPTNRPLDVVDQHFYRPTRFFRQASRLYDRADRAGPRIYVGEYAASHDAKAGTLRGALADACFLTGIERNCDLVTLAAYAPLLCREDWGKWSPNLIHFDRWHAWGKPSYHAQALFARGRGDMVVSCEVTAPAEEDPPKSGGIALQTALEGAAFADVSVTAPDGRVLLAGPQAPWKLSSGDYQWQDGVLTRTGSKPRSLAAAKAGDQKWGDAYDIALRVRMPAQQDDARSLNWKSGLRVDVQGGRFTVGLGNWGNHVHSIEGMNNSEVRPGSLVPGQWHHVRITVRGQAVKVLLDGKVATEGTQEPVPVVCASATKSHDGRTLYLKVVNSGPAPAEATLDLGRAQPRGTAQVWQLSSDGPESTNTASDPNRVVPRSMTWENVASHGLRTFPPWSLTVAEVPLENR
jgi:alpha-L-arabinofuranosidase